MIGNAAFGLVLGQTPLDSLLEILRHLGIDRDLVKVIPIFKVEALPHGEVGATECAVFL